MKKIVLLSIVCLSVFSCVDMDVVDWNHKDTSVFPITKADADAMMTGIYNAFNNETQDYRQSQLFIAEMCSDDRFGGGGVLDRAWAATDKFMTFGVNQYETYWRRKYEGLFRANVAIESMGNLQGVSQSVIDDYTGQAYFLRAYFLFTLAQQFGEVPMPITSASVNLPKSPAKDIYSQVAADLKKAIGLLPAKRLVNFPGDNDGHVNKWAAEAMLARVFLFYTGYYGESALPLSDGVPQITDKQLPVVNFTGTIEKAEVVSGLEDLINNGGYSLVPDFRNIWPYSNAATKRDWKYSQNNNLKWVGDGSQETIFAYKFGNVNNTNFTNQVCLAMGLRTPNGTDVGEGKAGDTWPWGNGWGACTVNSQLWDEWTRSEPNDMRREASILNANGENSEVPNFVQGADGQAEETGMWQKKMLGICCFEPHAADAPRSDWKFGTSYTKDPEGDPSGQAPQDPNTSFQHGFTQDRIVIRLADVYLMHSELTGTTTYWDRVRERAGLASVGGFDMEKLKKERRFELAFEGIRYYDLMRWHDAEKVISANQEGIPIIVDYKNSTTKAYAGGYAKRYQETGGFHIIPESQIQLSDGVLTQNKGWDLPGIEFSTFDY